MMGMNIQTKRISSFVFLFFFVAATMLAQRNNKPTFDPKRFEADLEQFITTHAGLSIPEASIFFPLHREMMKKQRIIFDEMRRYHHIDTRDNEACAQAIRKQDELDIEIKQIQQEYHAKFMQVLPAGKVMQIIKAEEKFHRQMFKRMRHK